MAEGCHIAVALAHLDPAAPDFLSRLGVSD
jgi:hypothetical protein